MTIVPFGVLFSPDNVCTASSFLVAIANRVPNPANPVEKDSATEQQITHDHQKLRALENLFLVLFALANRKTRREKRKKRIASN